MFKEKKKILDLVLQLSAQMEYISTINVLYDGEQRDRLWQLWRNDKSVQRLLPAITEQASSPVIVHYRNVHSAIWPMLTITCCAHKTFAFF